MLISKILGVSIDTLDTPLTRSLHYIRILQRKMMLVIALKFALRVLSPSEDVLERRKSGHDDTASHKYVQR